MVEHLSSMCKALGLILRTELKKKLKQITKKKKQSTSYLVHAAGMVARDQTCHNTRQLLKILFVPGALTSWSWQLHCEHTQVVISQYWGRLIAVLCPVELSARTAPSMSVLPSMVAVCVAIEPTVALMGCRGRHWVWHKVVLHTHFKEVKAMK